MKDSLSPEDFQIWTRAFEKATLVYEENGTRKTKKFQDEKSLNYFIGDCHRMPSLKAISVSVKFKFVEKEKKDV